MACRTSPRPRGANRRDPLARTRGQQKKEGNLLPHPGGTSLAGNTRSLLKGSRLFIVCLKEIRRFGLRVRQLIRNGGAFAFSRTLPDHDFEPVLARQAKKKARKKQRLDAACLTSSPETTPQLLQNAPVEAIAPTSTSIAEEMDLSVPAVPRTYKKQEPLPLLPPPATTVVVVPRKRRPAWPQRLQNLPLRECPPRPVPNLDQAAKPPRPLRGGFPP